LRRVAGVVGPATVGRSDVGGLGPHDYVRRELPRRASRVACEGSPRHRTLDSGEGQVVLSGVADGRAPARVPG
jgi:hypothetical protein